MLKAAVATGTIAATWVAPHIETFGFAPAFAATMCSVTSPANDDLHGNSGSMTYTSFAHSSCGQSFGSSASSHPDTITFVNPTSTCASFTVRTQPEDCADAPPPIRYDPDVSGFVVVPYDSSGTCNCSITAVVIYSTPNTPANPDFPPFTSMANPFVGCPTGSATNGPTGPGIRVNLPCTINSNSRMSVQISCTTTGHC
jgi:hypothetical protein